MPRWIWSEKQKKLITPEEFAQEVGERRAGYHIQPDIEPFVSPVTRELITSRSKLREHNKVNNVTNAADYKETWKQWEKDRKNLIRNQRGDRIEALRHAVQKHSGR